MLSKLKLPTQRFTNSACWPLIQWFAKFAICETITNQNFQTFTPGDFSGDFLQNASF